jgi:hypothetical protein
MYGIRLTLVLVACAALAPLPARSGGKEDGGVRVDKEKRTITIDAKIAPRKLADPKFQGKIYPIEVIACWPYPKGQKAHETVVSIEAKPSVVHKALVDFGLKPGKPVFGGENEVPEGPEVNIFLEIPAADGTTKKVSIDKTLLSPSTKKPFPKSVKFRFTGSVMKKPDPNKDEMVYGADMTGTLITIFPVTNEAVFQTSLSMKYEGILKLETNTDLLPKEGTPVKLVIEVPPAK